MAKIVKDNFYTAKKDFFIKGYEKSKINWDSKSLTNEEMNFIFHHEELKKIQKNNILLVLNKKTVKIKQNFLELKYFFHVITALLVETGQVVLFYFSTSTKSCATNELEEL
jgi:hypothetical protein